MLLRSNLYCLELQAFHYFLPSYDDSESFFIKCYLVILIKLLHKCFSTFIRVKTSSKHFINGYIFPRFLLYMKLQYNA